MKVAVVLLGVCVLACAGSRTQRTIVAPPTTEAKPSAAEEPVAAAEPKAPAAPETAVTETAVTETAATKPAAADKPVQTSFSWTLEEGERSIPMPVRCMYDVKQNRYRNCMAASAGRCQHFGVPCNAEGTDDRRRPCLYDARQDKYRQCLSVHAGRCMSYSGGGCSPGKARRACVYNSRDERYQRCASMANGRCQHFAAPCTPEQTPK